MVMFRPWLFAQLALLRTTTQQSIEARPVAKMLTPKLARASALRGPSSALRRLPVVQKRLFWPEVIHSPEQYEKRYPTPKRLTEEEDPDQTGGYVNPPRVSRQFRDPYGDWWDKQERRNFGEPCHTDNDVLGIFAPYEYTWTTTGKGLLQMGGFIVTFLGVLAGVYYTYPDRQSYPREYEGGLQRELGGTGTLRARKPGDPDPF